MRARLLARYGLLVCAALLALTSCDQITQLTKPTVTTHVLFIGNSFTMINNGIDKELEGLSPSTETERFAIGGYTLENHWNDGKALQAIRKGGWDFVVLQEQSQTPIVSRSKFEEYARYFDAEIKDSGAKTILLMTWERPDSAKNGVTAANLATEFNAIGKAIDARIAPAGLAFARSLREKPGLALYAQDGHPTVAGTYLAACVLYATILGKSPIGNSYSDSSITAEQRAYLQKIAAETVGY